MSVEIGSYTPGEILHLSQLVKELKGESFVPLPESISKDWELMGYDVEVALSDLLTRLRVRDGQEFKLVQEDL